MSSRKIHIKYSLLVLWQKLIPYRYKPERYKNSFLTRFEKKTSVETEDFPLHIVCFWTGTNLMTENRKKCLADLQNNSKTPVLLIHPENLQEYILKDYPLHPAYENLSLVHKSDYLRCYFMHHYGGGYSDIKSTKNSWKKAFDMLEKDKTKWILGYSEIKPKYVASLEGKLGRDLKRYYCSLIGNGAYIVRPHTPFTYEWYHELHQRMDTYETLLAKYPGNILGDNEGYPIPWTGILGEIFHPLCLKYKEKIIHSDSVMPDFSNYR